MQSPMKICPASIIRERLETRRIHMDGRLFLYSYEQGYRKQEAFQVSAIGETILGLCDGERTVCEICNIAEESLRIPRSQLLPLISSLFQKLTDHELYEIKQYG